MGNVLEAIYRTDRTTFETFLTLNSRKYKKLYQTIQYIYEENILKEYLFDIEKFEYNGHSDKRQVFHFRNIGMFLYFGQTIQNYTKLVEIIKNQGWLILLFKNGEFRLHDS